MGSSLCKCCCKSSPDVDMKVKDNETECCENITCCVTYNTHNIEDKCKKECEDIDKKIQKLQNLKIEREHYYKEKREQSEQKQFKKKSKSRKNKNSNNDSPLQQKI
jgi:hypothetical protein